MKYVEKLCSLATYSLTTGGIVVNLDNIKSGILFVGALILLCLQIKLHLIKIKKEKDRKGE